MTTREFAHEIAAMCDRGASLPNGAKGRLLFNAFLAMATAENGAQLTVAEVADLCAYEAKKAVEMGLVR